MSKKQQPPGTFLGRHSVLDLCADDIFRVPGTGGRLGRLQEKDHDGGDYVVITYIDLETKERNFKAIRTTARLNVWAD